MVIPLDREGGLEHWTDPSNDINYSKEFPSLIYFLKQLYVATDIIYICQKIMPYNDNYF